MAVVIDWINSVSNVRELLLDVEGVRLDLNLVTRTARRYDIRLRSDNLVVVRNVRGANLNEEVLIVAKQDVNIGRSADRRLLL